MLILSRLKRRIRGLTVIAATSSILLGNVASVTALNTSSLQMTDPQPDATSVTYTFTSAGFDTGTSLQCISLDFDTQSDNAGGAPSGLVTTGASLDASGTLITEASWTQSFATNGSLDITYATGEAPAASGTLVFTGITNGDTESTTYYAILSTFTNTDCSTGLVDSTVVAFVYNDGELVQLTIDPTLTFTVAGVAAGQTVNGATTTHASTGTGINYLNDVTSSTNGVSAHDIQVSTNATGGYIVYLRHSGNLTNQASNTITNHTGTNLSPTAFTAAGTESWGYTTADATLSNIGDGPNRFTASNEWAGFTTSNAEVVVNTTATTGTQTTRVGHQVGVNANTEAGTYQTTMIYTVVATF